MARLRIKAVLQLGDDARLLGQQVLRLASERFQQPLNARNVAGRLGQRARENCCSAE